MRSASACASFGERDAVEQVERRRAVRALAEPGSRVRLRVEVDDERRLAGLREAGGEVDRGRRLADAALLVRERVDPAGHTRHASYASGRFRATPGRRGKPGGVGPSLRRTSSPAAVLLELGRRAARPPARPRSASAVGPTQSTAAPPGATSGRHHSAATGGGASAFATATPPARRAPAPRRGRTRPARSAGRASSARGTRTCAASPRAASTSRSGSATASGIPGAPPPEPTSTIGPSKRRTSSSAAQAPSRARAAPPRRRDRVSPGVATTLGEPALESHGADRRRSGWARCPRSRLDAGVVLQAEVHDLALDRRHRLELDRRAV